jgi:hypothetical protein
VCLDTDILVGLLKNDGAATQVIAKLQSEGQSLKTTIVTAYELLKGSAVSSMPEQNLAKVRMHVALCYSVILAVAIAAHRMGRPELAHSVASASISIANENHSRLMRARWFSSWRGLFLRVLAS